MKFRKKPRYTDIESAIVRRIRPPEGAAEAAVYDFQCPFTGRQFLIRRYGCAYLLEELVPVGIWDERLQTRVYDELFESLFARARPNDFKHVLRRKLPGQANVDCPGVSQFLIIRSNLGEGVPVYQQSLAECALRIGEALKSNHYYRAYADAHASTQAEELAGLRQEIFYWELIQTALDTIEPATVFQGTYSLAEGRLSDALKHDLLSYFNAPALELWDRLYDQTIVHNDSLWKAWCDYDPTAPRDILQKKRRIWPRIPAGSELRNAVRACVNAHREQAASMLAEKSERLERLKKKHSPLLTRVQ